MGDEDKKAFSDKIKLMLLVINNNHVPGKDLIGAYWYVLKDFTLAEVEGAIDTLMQKMNDHITPAHIRRQIQGEPNTRGAFENLSKPHWERMGYPDEAAYDKANHEKWLKAHPGLISMLEKEYGVKNHGPETAEHHD